MWLLAEITYRRLTMTQHIIRCTPKKRVTSRLYMFNSVGMLGVYLVVVILNFVLYVASLGEAI